jgi:hypothetical protein
MMQHSNELLHTHSNFAVNFQYRLISHEKRTKSLQDRDLNREIERSNYANWSIWPSISVTLLTCVISRISKRSSKISNVISRKVFKELLGNNNFSSCLSVRLWNNSLNQTSEESFDLFLSQKIGSFMANISI